MAADTSALDLGVDAIVSDCDFRFKLSGGVLARGFAVGTTCEGSGVSEMVEGERIS